MQKITFTGQVVGNVAWELPKALEVAFSAVPKEKQAVAREALAKEAEAMLILVVLTTLSGPKALGLMRKHRQQMTNELSQLLGV